MADPFFKDLAFAALAQTARNPIGDFNRSVLGAQQLQRPAEPYLRQQYPEVYGGLGGFMGMAPDEMGGSVLDPNTARVRAGAQIGFPIGTATQVVPALNLIRPAVKAGARALGPTAVSMGEGYLQRQGLMPGVVEGESIGMLGGPIKPQAPVSKLGFYSAAEQAALNLPRKSGTGESFLNDLIKGQDVKKDELSWMGLDDYLKGKPNVTRQEVQDFIANNRVDVQERQLGAAVAEDPVGIAQRKAVFDKYEPQIQALYKEMDNPRYRLVNRGMGAEEYNRGVVLQNRSFRGEPLTAQEQSELNGILQRLDGNTVKEFANVEEARKVYTGMSQEEKLMHSIRPVKSSTQLQEEINNIQNIRDTEANAAYVVPEPTPTKYKKYQLPGGDNYREILLTTPVRGKSELDAAQIAAGDLRRQTADLMEKWKAASELNPGDPSVVALYQKVADSRRLRDQAETKAQELKNQIGSQTYQSSHFNEPNVLAHMRVNDRIDADGKKMLLIEEVQSDWHQAGRERGYAIKNARTATEVERELTATTQKRSRLLDEAAALPDSEMTKFKAMNEEIKALSEKATKLNEEWTGLYNKPKGVPDAPFKDTWHQLALKRALKYAADNGYDRVGLTTGAQQAKRYDLSKSINDLQYDPKTKTLTAWDHNGNQVVNQTDISENQLSEYIGKEGSKKLLAQNPQDTHIKQLFGVDLQVGGEGMKKYYDEIYPAFFSKQGKKYNAKTGETRIKTGQGIPGGAPVRYIDISPEMRGGVSKGQPLFTAAPIGGIGLGAGTQDDQRQPAVKQAMNEFEQSLINFMATPAK